MNDDLLELARRVAGEAQPNEHIEVLVSRGRDTDVRAYRGAVESLTVAGSEGIGVRVISEGRQGLAWAGTLEATAVAETLAAARDNARFSEPDEYVGLATPIDVASAPIPELSLWDDTVLRESTESKVARALELEAATIALDARVRNVRSASYTDGWGASALVNSLGVEAVSASTGASCSVSALATDGDETQTAGGFSVARGFAGVDVAEAAAMAVTRATRLLGAVSIPSRRVLIILDPMVTRSFLALIGAACNAESVQRGRSMFGERMGESIGSESVTLIEDPTIQDAYGASTHDGEGIPTRRITLIDRGVLRSWLHNTYTARKGGTTTTASAVRGLGSAPGVGARALFLAPGPDDPDAILASVPEALYVQSVSGLHSGTNTASGDFSVGADGLMVRGGAFAEPVREVTVASTLPRMLLDITAVGSDLTWLPGGGAGQTVLIGEMSLAGRDA
ncbi:MAG: TldD/PmbA family protein [Acidimicrobiia bacterium]